MNPVSKQRNSRDCPRRFRFLGGVAVTGKGLPLPVVSAGLRPLSVEVVSLWRVRGCLPRHFCSTYR